MLIFFLINDFNEKHQAVFIIFIIKFESDWRAGGGNYGIYGLQS